jgi:hypothetical protein
MIKINSPIWLAFWAFFFVAPLGTYFNMPPSERLEEGSKIRRHIWGDFIPTLGLTAVEDYRKATDNKKIKFS